VRSGKGIGETVERFVKPKGSAGLGCSLLIAASLWPQGLLVEPGRWGWLLLTYVLVAEGLMCGLLGFGIYFHIEPPTKIPMPGPGLAFPPALHYNKWDTPSCSLPL
jgi:hypothetical protein